MMDLKNTRLKQSEIWLFDPEPTKGRELGKKVRPCLIISNSLWNKIPTGLAIIVPLTSVKKGISTHVRIPAREGGLPEESYALCEQIRCVSKERLIKKLGTVSRQTLEEVYSWILDLISLDSPTP